MLVAAVISLALVARALRLRKHDLALRFHLEQAQRELIDLANRDHLTGAWNRRHIERDFDRVVSHQHAMGEESWFALFDIDRFKAINDTWGHGAGDAVLIKIAASLREILRETDMIVRWGGEEFLAFLPAIPRSGLDEVARRLLTGIAETRIEYGGETLSAQVSIGFAPYPLAPAGQPLPWERAVNLVDMALYMAKGHGRNRAYGLRGFSGMAQTSMEEIEQNLEQAWRAGVVDMSIVTAGWQELRASA